MEHPRRVILFGKSLFLAGIEASLKSKPTLDVTRVSAESPDALERLDALGSSVIVFDLATAQPGFDLALLQRHPAWVLIGLDLASDRAIVFSNQRSPVLTMTDLQRLIERSSRA